MKSSKLKALLSIVSISSTLLIASMATASVNKVYQLKGEAVSGSKIPVIEAISPVSFNKKYSSLSDAEKAIFNAKFHDLNTNDTPPFPSMGLRSIYKPIIKANKNINATGSLHLTATINANGFVESVKVLNSPNVKLAAHAEKVLRNTQFDPANCNGVDCEMTFPFEITFK